MTKQRKWICDWLSKKGPQDILDEDFVREYAITFNRVTNNVRPGTYRNTLRCKDLTDILLNMWHAGILVRVPLNYRDHGRMRKTFKYGLPDQIPSGYVYKRINKGTESPITQ